MYCLGTGSSAQVQASRSCPEGMVACVTTSRSSGRLQVATVRSAVKLEQEQQFLIAKKLQELTGSKNVKVKPVMDETLIAGFVVEYGSAQIDLSIEGQLKKITSELYAKYSDKAALV